MKTIAFLALATLAFGCAQTTQPETSAASAASAVSGARDASATESNDSRLTRNNSTQVVTDSSTKLEWEDNVNQQIKTTWPKANEHCNKLDFAGQQDWRLATTDELVALAKATKVKFPEKPILKSIDFFASNYWTSDTRKAMTDGSAKTVEFENFDWGEVGEGMQYIENAVRCVREMK